jgi:hypothetical protein
MVHGEDGYDPEIENFYRGKAKSLREQAQGSISG